MQRFRLYWKESFLISVGDKDSAFFTGSKNQSKIWFSCVLHYLWSFVLQEASFTLASALPFIDTFQDGTNFITLLLPLCKFSHNKQALTPLSALTLSSAYFRGHPLHARRLVFDCKYSNLLMLSITIVQSKEPQGNRNRMIWEPEKRGETANEQF